MVQIQLGALPNAGVYSEQCLIVPRLGFADDFHNPTGPWEVLHGHLGEAMECKMGRPRTTANTWFAGMFFYSGARLPQHGVIYQELAT